MVLVFSKGSRLDWETRNSLRTLVDMVVLKAAVGRVGVFRQGSAASGSGDHLEVLRLGMAGVGSWDRGDVLEL